MANPVRKAVFPVAGLGTRFLPATKVMPKEMLTVVDKPLIQHVVEEAKAAGIEQFILVTGRGKGILEDHFDRAVELEEALNKSTKEMELRSVRDTMIETGHLVSVLQPQPLGLGHAVWCAKELIGDEPFAVLSPDDLVLSGKGCLEQMMEAYAELGGNIVAVEDVPRAETNRYGVLDVTSDDGRLARVKGLIEKPDPKDAPSTLSIIGRYILQPEIFTHLDKHERGAGGEIQLTDAIAKTIGEIPFNGFRFAGQRFDCGSKTGFVAANMAYGLARPDLRDIIRAILKDVL
jgi:UTP--glucose-1-phosphate uridylyltransferase